MPLKPRGADVGCPASPASYAFSAADRAPTSPPGPPDQSPRWAMPFTPRRRPEVGRRPPPSATPTSWPAGWRPCPLAKLGCRPPWLTFTATCGLRSGGRRRIPRPRALDPRPEPASGVPLTRAALPTLAAAARGSRAGRLLPRPSKHLMSEPSTPLVPLWDLVQTAHLAARRFTEVFAEASLTRPNSACSPGWPTATTSAGPTWPAPSSCDPRASAD